MQDDTQNLANSLVKGIAYAENGGKPDVANPVAGKTGEAKSIFQYTPQTWAHDSQTYLGKYVPINPDAETYVMVKKVSKLIQDGNTARQIASMHNAGAGEPEAYTGKFSDGSPSVGINKKYGVKFDVPAYADKVVNYAKQFYQESLSNQGNKVAPIAQETPMNTETPVKQSKSIKKPSVGLLSRVMASRKKPTDNTAKDES